MFKKFTSMMTAAILLATGLSIFTATPPASAVSATFTIDCSDTSALTVNNGWEIASMGTRYATDGAGFQKFLVLNPADAYTFNVTNCGNIRATVPANSTAGTIALSGSNISNGSTVNASIMSGFSSYSILVTAGSTIPTLPISGGGSTGKNALTFQTNQGASSTIAVTFIDAATAANASLTTLKDGNNQNISGFTSSTTNYTINTSTQNYVVYPTAAIWGQPIVRTCNGTVLSSNTYGCSLNSGANTYTAAITALDGTTVNTYTLTLNYTAPTPPAITSTSTITLGQINPVLTVTASAAVLSGSSLSSNWTVNVGTTGLSRGTLSLASGVLTIPLMGMASAGTVTVQAGTGAFNPPEQVSSNTLSFVVSGGSSSSSSSSSPSQTPEQIAAAVAAAAKAAAEAAAAIRAAEIATAQTKLATALKGDKPGSIDDFKAANINVTTAASLARINAEVLKLSAAERSDFAKIKAIADKIEFDESFFNSTARPTVATYNAYGVTVTPRTVATINAKVLELPVAKRTDVTAIAEIAKVETFVDRVANTDTRSSVSAATLISKGLLPADTVYKYTVINGLSSYPEGSLNTMAKIEAAIKAELDKAGARKAKTEAIKAKIAARRK